MLLIGHFGCPIYIFSFKTIIWCKLLIVEELITQISWLFKTSALSRVPMSGILSLILDICGVKRTIDVIILEKLLIRPPRVHFCVTMSLILANIWWYTCMLTRSPLMAVIEGTRCFSATQTALSLLCYKVVQFIEIVVWLLCWFPGKLGLFGCHFEHFIRLCIEVHFTCLGWINLWLILMKIK